MPEVEYIGGGGAGPSMPNAWSILYEFVYDIRLIMSIVRNLRVKPLDSIGQYGALELRRVFPLSCSNDTLLDVFAGACVRTGFVLTERADDKASALKEVHNIFQCVIPGFSNPMLSRDVVVNMSITVNAKHDYKLLVVIGPKRPTMQAFIRALEQGLSAISHFWVSRFSDSVRRDFKFSFQESDSSSPAFRSMAESGNQSYKSEEAAYYYFYKILSNRGYSVGNDLRIFLDDFTSNFPQIASNPDQSPTNASVLSLRSSSSITDLASTTITATPSWSASDSAKKLSEKIETVIAQLDANYVALHNPSTALVDDLLPRLRPCVERFVFEAVGKCLWVHYRQAYLQEDKSYLMKSLAIRAAHGTSLAESCGIRPEFRFPFDRSVALMNELQQSFDKESAVVPNALLQRLLSIQISVKTEVLNGTRGAKELESMDDIAPIFLFVLLSATEMKTPNALYHLLLDTMRVDQRVESEGRTCALLEGATRLVMNDWHHTSVAEVEPVEMGKRNPSFLLDLS